MHSRRPLLTPKLRSGRAQIVAFSLFIVMLAFSFSAPAAPLRCEQLFSPFFSFTKSDWTWVDDRLTVVANLTGEHRVVIRENGQLKEITDPEQRRELAEHFYTQTRPTGSEVVVLEYPGIGRGLAYRVRRGNELYMKGLKPDADGVVQVPGLPPVYVRTIEGVEYVDIPHPDVFNAYVGRDFFFAYTSTKYERFWGEIPPLEYMRIVSYGRFPTTLVKTDIGIMTHDVFGHDIVMAAVRDRPVWAKTVDLAKRAFAIRDSIFHRQVGPRDYNRIMENTKRVLIEVSGWEIAANSSRIIDVRTPEELEKEIISIVARMDPFLDSAEKLLIEVEQDFAQFPPR